ncbi:hypothetical protein BC832DRAFT_543620 [Gaertneriomyces semiglobifer]|nr:hypothetical protein BC832DRAFT_543620 [Gaertneriomyces semiglobifer]
MLRPLGCLELYELTRSIADPPFYGNVFECVHVQATLKSVDFIEEVKHGLSRLVQRYPTLLTTVSEPLSSKPYWAWLEEVSWSAILRQVTLPTFDRQDVDAFVAHELDDAIDPRVGGPLWRVIVAVTDKLSSEWILAVSFNHCIMDGSAGRQFLTALVDAMNEVETLEPSPAGLSIMSRPSTIPLAFEDRCSIKATFWKVLPYLLPSFSTPTYWAGVNPCVHKKQRSVVRTLSVPLKDVVEASKREKTTVHAVLHTFAARTLSAMLGPGTKLVLTTPINPRRFCDKPGAGMDLENELGNAFAAYHYDYETLDLDECDATFWPQARSFRSALDEKIPKSVLEVTMLSYLRYPKDMIAFYLSKLKKLPQGRSESAQMSNVGKFSPKDYVSPKLTMKRAWFAQSPLLSGPAISMNVCSAGDVIHICLVSEETTLGDSCAFLKSFDDRWQEGIHKVLVNS